VWTLIEFVTSLSSLVWSLTVLVVAVTIFIAECYAVHTVVTVTREEYKDIFKPPLRRLLGKINK